MWPGGVRPSVSGCGRVSSVAREVRPSCGGEAGARCVLRGLPHGIWYMGAEIIIMDNTKHYKKGIHVHKDITITKNCKDDAVRGVSKNNQWCDLPCGIDAYHKYYNTILFDFYN